MGAHGSEAWNHLLLPSQEREQGVGSEVEHLRPKPVATMGCQSCRQQPNRLHHDAGPKNL